MFIHTSKSRFRQVKRHAYAVAIYMFK